MTRQEAEAKGAFERHPGCGCEIEYTTEKGTQRQTDWKTNTWEDVSPYERIARAAQEGDMVTIPPFMEGDFEDCHPLSISKEERAIFGRIHDEVLKTGNEYGEIITSEGIIPCESDKRFSVLMRTDTIDEYGLKLYHGHTNDTLPSEKDLLRFVTDNKVDTIGVVTRNRDVFVVSIGDGYVPDENNKNMSSEKALRTYTTLLKTVQPNEREDLQKAYHEIDDLILKRDFEEVKKGYMF